MATNAYGAVDLGELDINEQAVVRDMLLRRVTELEAVKFRAQFASLAAFQATTDADAELRVVQDLVRRLGRR